MRTYYCAHGREPLCENGDGREPQVLDQDGREPQAWEREPLPENQDGREPDGREPVTVTVIPVPLATNPPAGHPASFQWQRPGEWAIVGEFYDGLSERDPITQTRETGYGLLFPTDRVVIRSTPEPGHAGNVEQWYSFVHTGPYHFWVPSKILHPARVEVQTLAESSEESSPPTPPPEDTPEDTLQSWWDDRVEVKATDGREPPRPCAGQSSQQVVGEE